MARVAVLRTDEDSRHADLLVKSLLKDGFSAYAGRVVDTRAEDAVVVLWSAAAWRDPKLKAVARRARRRGRLIQIQWAEPPGPWGFGRAAPLILAGWRGGLSDPRFRLLAAGLAALDGDATPPPGLGFGRPRLGFAISAAGAAIVAFFAVLGALLNLDQARERVCGLDRLSGFCVRHGLAPPPQGPRAAFLGAWGPVGCKVRGVLSIRGDTLSWDWGDHRSAAHIDGEGKGSLYLLETSPEPGGRSEVRVVGDRMTVQVVGQPGETELFRCAAQP